MILARKRFNTTAVILGILLFWFWRLFYFKHTATHMWQLKAGMSRALGSYTLRHSVPFFKWPPLLGSLWLSPSPFHPSCSAPCTSRLNADKGDGSWQQRELVSAGAHQAEDGPRQFSLKVFPYVSHARQQLLAPRAHISSCLAFDIVCFHVDDGWWTPNHCSLLIFIAPTTQTPRYVTQTVKGNDRLHHPLCIINHVAESLKAKLAK